MLLQGAFRRSVVPIASSNSKTGSMRMICGTLWWKYRHRFANACHTDIHSAKINEPLWKATVTTAQAILYGMKHDHNTANMICRIKMIQCNKWTPMHFNMHYNADPGRSWNNTPSVFRVETNDHKWTSELKSPCVGITVFATPAYGFKTKKCCSKPWAGNQWQTLKIDGSDEK